MSAGGRDLSAMRGNLLVAALIIGGLAVFFWISGLNREASLRQSQVGFDALAIWLRDNGERARVVTGWERIDPREVSLRILPLYDVDLRSDFEAPDDQAALLRLESESDMAFRILIEKIESLPTLVILPKWRTGMRMTGVAHADLLNDQAKLEQLLRELVAEPGAFTTPEEPFSRHPAGTPDGQALTASLYQARALAGAGCDPVVGTRDAMVLGRCRLVAGDGVNVRFWLLADPDLMNAHGLRLGDNADIAVELVRDLTFDGLTVIDYTNHIWSDVVVQRGERSWADLARFFGYPFTPLWVGLAAVLGLILWRASVRYGAAVPLAEGAPKVAKATSIQATARLLRLSGNDNALVTAFARQRLQLAAAEILGPRRSTDVDRITQFLRWVGQRDERLADKLASYLEDRPGMDALRRLDELETNLSKVLNESGRTPRDG